MTSTRKLKAALPTKRTMSQVVLTVIRVGDGVGIAGLSLAVRQTVQVALALTGGTGLSKRPFANLTLSFSVSFCYRFGSLVFQ